MLTAAVAAAKTTIQTTTAVAVADGKARKGFEKSIGFPLITQKANRRVPRRFADFNEL